MFLKSLKKSIIFSFIAVFCYGFFISCDNPFTGNLGGKVDVEPPTIMVTAPTSGAYIQGTTRFTGNATAYRDLRRVDVRIFNPNVTAERPGSILVDWINILELRGEKYSWVNGSTLTGEAKAKTWSLDLDTLAFAALYKLDDGFLKVQFRASDPNLSAETIQLVYIVKNKPSVIKLTAPEHNAVNETVDDPYNDKVLPKLITGTELRGQIIDRRGIKPGYPRIKIWQEDLDDPLLGEPFKSDDPEFGWATLFLSGVDDLPADAEWTYADRRNSKVENARSFVLRLAEFTIAVDPNNPDLRQIKYNFSSEGKFVHINPDRYRFRIKTSDTYFYTDTKAANYMRPRGPEGNEEEAVGYYPDITAEIGDETEWDKSGPSYAIQVIGSGVRPTVQIDNYDIDDEVLAATPNFYINEVTTKKIAMGQVDRPDFRLQILTSHPEGIEKATLWYELAGTSRHGYLPWDPVGDRGYADDTVGTVPDTGLSPAPTYQEYYGHRGWFKNGDIVNGTLFRFTADGGRYGDIFQTSTEPYTLIATVFSTGGFETEQRYTLYMDGRSPDVNIRSMRGASAEPEGSGDPNDAGGITNNAAYIVNGNIQVSLDRSDDMGIIATKWIVETKAPSASDSLLSALRRYRNNPNAGNLNFFNIIGEGHTSGNVIPPVANAPLEADRTFNFKFNTFLKDSNGKNAWNGQDMWLYIIAQDGVQNLGFVLQKLTVDDSGDYPVLDVPSDLFSTTDAGGITDEKQLYWDITGTFPIGSNENRAKNRWNEGIDLGFVDDDGIKLEGIKITLTNLDDTSITTKTLSVAQLQSFLNGKVTDGSSREWTGVLSQQIMAQILYGNQSLTKLPDGLYKLTIQVTDNVDAKVAIVPPVRDGDTPVAVTTEEKVFFFAVQNEEPEINIIAPTVNQQLGKDSALTIYGTVRSRLRVQKLQIGFDPDVISATAYPRPSPVRELKLYRDALYQNEVVPFGTTGFTGGYYVYYWKYAGDDGTGVRFGRDDFTPVSDDREFTLTAWDGMNYPGSVLSRVNVDNTPPDVEMDLFNFDREGYQNVEGDTVNGKVPVEISVYDENGIGITYVDTVNNPPNPSPNDTIHVKWWVRRIDLPAPSGWDDTAYDTAPYGARGQFIRADMVIGGKYLAVFDTTGFTDGERYHLYAMAKDGAENTKSVERLTVIKDDKGNITGQSPFTVGKAGDLPVVKEVNPQGNATVSNITGLNIVGLAVDDDGYDFTKLGTRKYAQIRFPKLSAVIPEPSVNPNYEIPEGDWSGWEDLALEMAGDDVKFTLNTSIDTATGLNTNHWYFKATGYKYYQIKLIDEPTAGAKASGSNYGTPPGKNPEQRNLGLTQLGEAEWIYPNKDGIHNYYDFLLKNRSPEVFFDNYDPAPTTADHPLSGPDGWQKPSRPAYSNTTINSLRDDLRKGYIREATNVVKANFYFNNVLVGDVDNNFGEKLTRGTGDTIDQHSWNLTDAELDALLPGFAGLPEGLHGIAIEAWDSGGLSGRAEWSFWKDNNGPTISATNVDMSANLADRIITGRAGSDVLIRGLFSDTLSNVSRNFDYRFDNEGTWREDGKIGDEVPAGRTMQWAVVVPSTLGDGEHTLNIRARDVANNQTVTAPNANPAILTNIPIIFMLDRTAPAVTSPENMIVKMTDTGVDISRKLADYERIFSAAYATTTVDNVEVFTLRGLVYDRHLSGLTARFYPGGAAGALEDPLAEWIPPATWPNTDYAWKMNAADTNSRLRVKRAETSDYDTTGNSTTLPPRIHNEYGVNNTGAANAFNANYLYVWELKVLKSDLKKILDKVPTTTTGLIEGEETDDGKIRRQIAVTAQDRAGRTSDMQNWRFYLDDVKPKIDFVNAHVAPVVDGVTGYKYYTTSSTASIAESLRPARLDIVGGNFSLTGSASDGTYIKDIRFILSKSYDGIGGDWRYYTSAGTPGWTSGTRPAWRSLIDAADTGVNSKSNVSWTLNNSKLGGIYPATLSNGLYQLELEVTDYSIANTGADPGNPATAKVQFYIDDAEPAIIWRNNGNFNSSLVQQDFYHPDDLTFYFTTSDANNIAGYLSAEVRRYGETTPVSGVTVTATPTAGTANASPRNVTVTIKDLEDDTKEAAASRFTLVLNVRDLSGKEATDGNTLNFFVDNKPPEMDLNPKPVELKLDPEDSNETIVGRVVLRGSFIKNISRSPVARVAFKLAESTNGMSFVTAPTAPARGLTSEAQLKAANWYFNDGTNNANNNPVLSSGGKRLAEITDGLSNANVILPNTRSLMANLNEATGTRYLLNNHTITAAEETAKAYTYNKETLGEGEIVNELRIYFLLIDEVGNSTVETVTYYVYPAGDRPVVTVITSPDQSIAEEQRLLNGTIRIGGQAVDNVYVKNVWFRVLLPESTTPTVPVDLYVPNWNQTTWVEGEGKQDSRSIEGTTGWYMANGGGSRTVTWSANINANGELDPSLGQRNKITIEVRAEDSVENDDGTGYDFNNTLFSNPLDERAKVSAWVVSGGAVFTDELVLNGKSADAPTPTVSGAGGWGSVLSTHLRKRASYAIKVEHISPIQAIRWTRPNNAGTVNLLEKTGTSESATYNTETYITHLNGMDAASTSGPGIVAKAVDATPSAGYSHAYWVVVDINSTILEGQGGNWANRADNYTLSLAALDSSRPSPLISYREAKIPIDNLPPRGYYTHSTNVAGQAPSFGGTAGDHQDGVIGGFSRVVLWFSRSISDTQRSIPWEELDADGEIIPDRAFQGGGPIPDGVTLMAGVTMPLIPAESATSGNYSSIVIDRNDPRGSQQHHGHQHKMAITPGGDLGNNWYVLLDSTLMTSGRTIAHFIVYDKAGNASYFNQPLMILNNIPRITRITLGTDIRGDLNLQANTNLGVSTQNRSISVLGGTYTGASNNKSALQTIRDTFKGDDFLKDKLADLSGEELDTAVGIKTVRVDTTTLGDHNVVYDEPFNVRNNLLTIGVEIGENMRSKHRRYSVQYVTGVASTLSGSNFYRSIVAGRVYMIDNPGAGFPWGLFGAPGDTNRRGFVFLATESGTNVSGMTTGTYGGASVWELSLASTDAGNGSLAYVQYPNTTSTTNGDGKIVEFVYGTRAFSTATPPIPDFTPVFADNNSDGRPLPYLQDTATPWTNHSLFVVRVFDSDNATPTRDDELFGDFALLSIRVNNSDKTRPFAQLYDLNPLAQQAASSTVLNPGSVGGNRTKSGLWSTTENDAIVKSGHIEPRATTSLSGTDMGGAPNTNRATIYNPMVTPATTANAFFDTDTVSGEVILRGYVEDDQRIGEVALEFISTTTTTVNLLRSKTAGTSASDLLEAVDAGRVSFVETIDLDRHRVEWAYLWNSEAMPANLIVGDINVRVIAYAYNRAQQSTERARNNAGNAVFDYYNPGFPTYSASDANIRRYNRIPVNIRPYITGILRDTSAHNTRSRQGWYMLAQNETAVVKGFNLGGGNTTRTAISLSTGYTNTNNAIAVTAARAGDFGLTGTPSASRYRQFTVNPAQTTDNGMVTLTVGTYSAVNTGRGITNNRPIAIQPWNTERSPDIAGSDLWDDFTSVHIWKSDNTSNTGTTATDNGAFLSTDDWVILDPAMSIDPNTGILYASYNEGGIKGGTAGGPGNTTSNGALLMRSTNNQNSQTVEGIGNNGSNRLMFFRDPMIHSNIYRSASATWSVTSIIGVSSSTGGGNVWRAFGGIYIHGPDGKPVELSYVDANRGGVLNLNNNNNFYLAESTWYNAAQYSGTGTGTTNNRRTNPPSTDQFLNPHIVTSGANDLHIHVSYYDSKDGSIKYRYNRRNAAGTIDIAVTNPPTAQQRTDLENIPKMWTNLDGGYDADDIMATTYTDPDVGTTPIGAGARVVNYDGTTRPGTTSKNDGVIGSYTGINAGEHNAIAVTGAGNPVVAYYDATHQQLKLAISNSNSPILASAWTIQDNIIPTDNLSYPGTGQYVSMAINGTTVHIAALNATSGNLVYVTGTVSTTAFTLGSVQVVDSNGTVGRWCNISLDSEGNPWIAYQDTGYIGSRDGVKLAYLNQNRFTKGRTTHPGKDIDLNGGNVSGWETMHAPTTYTVENPIIGTGELGRIGLENFPTIRNTTPGAKSGLSNFAAVSYLSSDKYRIAYYVK